MSTSKVKAAIATMSTLIVLCCLGMGILTIHTLALHLGLGSFAGRTSNALWLLTAEGGYPNREPIRAASVE
jgi:hypothetical protein